jgi:hypothetical protein
VLEKRTVADFAERPIAPSDRERTAHAVAYNSEGTVVRGHTGERTYRATFV